MLFDFAEIAPRNRYKLLASTVTPRPIAGCGLYLQPAQKKVQAGAEGHDAL